MLSQMRLYATGVSLRPSGHPAVLLDDGSALFGAGTRFYPAAWQ